MTDGVGACVCLFIFRDPDLFLYILNISLCSETFRGINLCASSRGLPSAAELRAARSDINGANRLRRCPPPSSVCLHPLSPRHLHPAMSLPFKTLLGLTAAAARQLSRTAAARGGREKKQKKQAAQKSSNIVFIINLNCEFPARV